MKLRKIFWTAFCAIACVFFICGFGYMIHLSNDCVRADKEAALQLNDPSLRNFEWALYMGCCAPLGFALIWGVRLYDAIGELTGRWRLR